MKKETDFNIDDILEMEDEKETAIIMYDKSGELIQRFIVSNLVNISIKYKDKILHAVHKDGKVYDIDFYKMIIV